jgi:hypothetical protein
MAELIENMQENVGTKSVGFQSYISTTKEKANT